MTRNDPVDVLIIGAGASGAAIAWSLLETRMRILCLEQGDLLLQRIRVILSMASNLPDKLPPRSCELLTHQIDKHCSL